MIEEWFFIITQAMFQTTVFEYLVYLDEEGGKK